jgi:hypothetical protein
MNDENDTQAKDETGRQKGYGETSKARDTDLREQVTKAVGLRVGTPEDHGYLRDDGTPKPDSEGARPLDKADQTVLVSGDDRHPNLPDHANSDSGPKND